MYKVKRFSSRCIRYLAAVLAHLPFRTICVIFSTNFSYHLSNFPTPLCHENYSVQKYDAIFMRFKIIKIIQFSMLCNIINVTIRVAQGRFIMVEIDNCTIFGCSKHEENILLVRGNT